MTERSGKRGGALGLALVGVLLGACEARVEEPDPQPPRAASVGEAATTPSSAAANTATANGPTTGATSPARCLVPLPEKPRRPLKPGPDPKCPEDIDGRYSLPRTPLTFEPAGLVVDAEVAAKPAHRARGLMFRRELADNQGMIFSFKRPRVQRFWMKNTCLPLDMLFVDKDGVIVGIEENVPTLNENSYFVRCPSNYVIEVNAGWSRKHGVKPGQRVKFTL